MKVIDVLKDAVMRGACEKSGKATDWKSLCWLFFTPQGREFCKANNFPSIKQFRDMAKQVIVHGIYVDCGEIEVHGKENVGLVGNTSAKLHYSSPSKLHRVVLMHGARAEVYADNYSVVTVTNIGDCEVVKHESNGGKIFVE